MSYEKRALQVNTLHYNQVLARRVNSSSSTQRRARRRVSAVNRGLSICILMTDSVTSTIQSVRVPLDNISVTTH